MRPLACARKCGLRLKVPNADHSPETLKPLTLADLDAIFAPLLPLKSVLLAVSGGSDSLALLFLCHQWRAARSVPLSIHVVSVDHGLRPEAASECTFVAAQAQKLGFDHATLKWTPPSDLSNLQAEARVARYRLLVKHAQSLGCAHIVLAHHQDDQAETFMIRLMRGSGVTGLGAMRVEQSFHGVTLLRPLLDVPKARLQASLKALAENWIEDPSNADESYLRVRVRSLLPILAKEGCDADRLTATARRMQRADRALEALSGQVLETVATETPGRSLLLRLDALRVQEEEIRLRLWRACLIRVAGDAYPPREEKLQSLDASLTAKADHQECKRTLGGCCFAVCDDRLWIYREAGRVPFELSFLAGDPVEWPGLYKILSVNGIAPTTSVTMRPLGRDGVTSLEEAGLPSRTFRAAHHGLAPALIHALPSIWLDNRPVFVIDWPEVADLSGIRVEFEEKVTKCFLRETEN